MASSNAAILRSTVDSYRDIVAEVSGRVVTGVATRREVTQQALDKFARQGITSFTDRAGRRWHMDTYAEMAIRTAALRALKAGHNERLQQRGYDIVRISSHAASAPQCVPFQGKLISLSGKTPAGPVEDVSRMTGEPVTATVMCSMEQAEARGLHHPNCKHTHSLWVPGAPPPPVVEDDDGKQYAAEQKLRRMERGVRQAKREQAAAITPDAKRKAGAKIRARQAAIRDHVTATGVRRKNHREQLRTGNEGNATEPVTLTRNPTPTPDPPPAPPAPPAAAPSAAPRPKGPREFKDLTDEELDGKFAEAVEAEDIDLLERLEAEDIHRRELAQKQAERAAARDAEYDRLLAEGLDDESAIEKAYGVSVVQQRRTNALAVLRANGHNGKGFDECSRAAFKEHAYNQWLDAENATNGYLLSKAGESAGIDPRSLWHSNEATARKYASEELRAHWDQVGRVTLAEFQEELIDPASAYRMRAAREDFLQ
ncbi:phage minor capsid protein [Nocardia salmonicida]|uniref:phage minor capsid protein n=1 Tax=Nocardia salmonicida TaxID=53431 RepID=UPI00365C4CF0